jgi:hypothetical protein
VAKPVADAQYERFGRHSYHGRMLVKCVLLLARAFAKVWEKKVMSTGAKFSLRRPPPAVTNATNQRNATNHNQPTYIFYTQHTYRYE